MAWISSNNAPRSVAVRTPPRQARSATRAENRSTFAARSGRPGTGFSVRNALAWFAVRLRGSCPAGGQSAGPGACPSSEVSPVSSSVPCTDPLYPAERSGERPM